MTFPSRESAHSGSRASRRAIFSHDKIVQIAWKQAKYPRYYRMLAGRIRLDRNNVAREQLFPPRIKKLELVLMIY
jgi:hypothetical protein